MDTNEMQNKELENKELENKELENKGPEGTAVESSNLMNGDFETDFFSPLPPEEPKTPKQKKGGKGNRKVLIGVIAAVVVVAVVALVILIVNALGRSPKERFIEGMEALMAEYENPGPSWQEEIDYESIEAALYTDAVSVDAGLNLTVQNEVTVGVDVLLDSDYPNKLANANIAVSVYNVPLLEADVTLDDDVWYFGLPELIEEVYSVDGATMGEDFNASDWTYQLGLYLDEGYVWDGFTGPQYTDEFTEAFNEMIAEDIDKIKEGMEVEEEDGNSKNDYLHVVLKKEDINGLLEDILEYFEETGYMEAEEMYLPTLAEDMEFWVAMDGKDRIVELATLEPITFEEEFMGEWAFDFVFSGKKNVTDSIEGTILVEMDGTSGSGVVEYEATEDGDIYETEMVLSIFVGEGDESVMMEVVYDREWNQKEKEFDESIEVSMDGDTYTVEAKGSFADIVPGEQFTMDLKKLSLSENDTELFKITGDLSFAPFEGNIEVPSDAIGIFELSEAELNALLEKVINAVYEKVLGE